ncbi:MAG TPA: hypothetical protein VKW08_20085 [Xanthobacteraceae bacterium]|jgi:hypothetical protein|nr:hypothetical protein [Xanthobacteraceae bacterium]
MKRTATKWAAIAALLVLGGLVLGPAGAAAQGTANAAAVRGNAAPQPRVHQPVHIRVRPLVQSYPGPDAVRQCAFWLATEYRPSGAVIVPRQHCWWEPG